MGGAGYTAMYDSRTSNDDTILLVRHDSGMTTFSYESGYCNMLNHLDNDTDCMYDIHAVSLFWGTRYESCMTTDMNHT